MSANSPDGRDLPLIAWGEELRRRKTATAKARRRVIAIGAIALVAMAPLLVAPSPRLVWNASASAPIGLYWVRPVGDLRRGDLVIARLPSGAAGFAARRHYLPLGVPVVKHVAGITGDRICGTVATITIDGRQVARRLAADRRGRPLPAWLGCMTLRANQLLLLNPAVADSYDGRYFGPTARRDVLGRAHPLWLR